MRKCHVEYMEVNPVGPKLWVAHSVGRSAGTGLEPLDRHLRVQFLESVETFAARSGKVFHGLVFQHTTEKNCSSRL
jgi:hypothetical protein